MREATQTIDILPADRNLYTVVEQEVDIGVRALNRQDADVAVTLFQSALHKLDERQPFYDHLVHNLLLGYRLLIDQALSAGNEEAARGFLRAALDLDIRGEMAVDNSFRHAFGGAFQSLGLTFFKRQLYDASILCFRKSIHICPSPGFNVNLMNALAASGQRALLSDFTTDVEPEQLGRHIFIACVPKSASTFLKNLLLSLTGYRDVFMVHSASQFEQELYLPTLRESAAFDTVTQQHCRASDANVQMMQAFGIRPVVLVRNIFDSVISLLDFYNAGASFYSYFRSEFSSLDEETKIDLLIDNFVPWYFQFVSSWGEVEKQKSLEIMWLSYEDMIRNKPGSIQNILKFYGLGAPLRGIEQKIRETESQKRNTRFNKGIAGRGVTGLTDRQKEKIRRHARYYPGTDFSRIGL